MHPSQALLCLSLCRPTAKLALLLTGFTNSNFFLSWISWSFAHIFQRVHRSAARSAPLGDQPVLKQPLLADPKTENYGPQHHRSINSNPQCIAFIHDSLTDTLLPQEHTRKSKMPPPNSKEKFNDPQRVKITDYTSSWNRVKGPTNTRMSKPSKDEVSLPLKTVKLQLPPHWMRGQPFKCDSQRA